MLPHALVVAQPRRRLVLPGLPLRRSAKPQRGYGARHRERTKGSKHRAARLRKGQAEASQTQTSNATGNRFDPDLLRELGLAAPSLETRQASCDEASSFLVSTPVPALCTLETGNGENIMRYKSKGDSDSAVCCRKKKPTTYPALKVKSAVVLSCLPLRPNFPVQSSRLSAISTAGRSTHNQRRA
jgi:hypothetical protein